MAQLPAHTKGDTYKAITLTYSEKVNGVLIPIDIQGNTIIVEFRSEVNGVVAFKYTTQDGSITILPETGKYRFNSRDLDVPAKTYIADVKFITPDGIKSTVTELLSLTVENYKKESQCSQ